MAAAHRSVLRQVENEITNKDAEPTQQNKDLQKEIASTKQNVQRKAVGAARNNTTASRRSAMRRSGRAGGATVDYREDSDPIEDCSTDEAGDDMGVDQAPAAARRQPARQQQKQRVDLGMDCTALDSENEAEPVPAAAKGAKEQEQQQVQVQPRQRRAAVVVSDAEDGGAPAAGGSSEEVLDASKPEEQQQDADSDFEERPAARKQPTVAAGRSTGRRAAQAAASSEEDDDDQGDASGEDEIEKVALEDSEQQQRQRRSKHGAAAAAAKKVRNSSGRRITRGQQQQAAEVPRRSTRGAAAATVTAAAEPGRPRRAAAAAATAATAAALLNEQQLLRFGGSAGSTGDDSDDDDDLGSAGDSEAEDEVLLGSDEGSSDAADDEHDSGSEGDEDGWEGGSSDGGSNKKRRAAAAAAGSRPVPRPPRRRSGSSTDEADDGDEQNDDDKEQAGSEAGGDAGEQDGLRNLNAFRFGRNKPAGAAGRWQFRSSASPPAAAGNADSPEAAGAGKAKAGTGSSKPGRSTPQSAVAKAEAVRDDAEADAREVCDPALFEPQLVARLPRGAEIERVLSVRYQEDGALQALLKLKGKSFRAAVWASSAQVEKAGKAVLLRNFLSKQNTDGSAEVIIDPRWYQVERVVEEYVHRKSGEREYLVKWANLDYSDATWELEEELARDGQGRAALARFKLWCTPPAVPPRAAKRPAATLTDSGQLPDFRNGRALRNYQETSLKWMVNNYRGEVRNGKWWPRNCILGDEMGLGKTAQSIAVMAWLKQYAGVSSPFMVVAPLTTLGHWQREIQTWTGMNVVLYTGSANDRRLIRETEFYYPSDRTVRKVLGPRFDVLLTSYETVLKDKTELRKLSYAALILDEAHRLKSRTSATRAALLELPVHWWLLLSGTPVQNNMRELQGLMSVLDDEAHGDVDDFLERFGDDKPSLEQIRALQAALAPVLLRRMKEDVEDLPEKEEVVIWVELTQEQRRYYRALYSKQIGSLLQGVAAKNLPGMRNLAMELRKLCCHPFLCDGLEEDMTARWEAARAAAAAAEGAAGLQKEVEALTRASGKMLLLHKLLPKLRAEGRQVLIFSQFKMMLDVLEDYLASCDYPFERIDGDTNHKDRQAAIDRFMAAKDGKPARSASPAADTAASAGSGAATGPASRDGSAVAAGEGGPFVFLLSTRAGGQGITLTSADTVIIYDSDWNPQNDLQAMARCHRIGQDHEVTVYRLVSKATYEQQLFECASRKYGLDEAILGFGGGENPENDAAHIEQLLRLGAHAIAGGGEEEQAEDKGMAAEGIDQILAGRSEKRQLGSRKGNTFSIAHFAAAGGGEPEPAEAAEPEADAAPVDAKAFWAGLLPEAVQAHEAALVAAKEPEVLGPRRRTVVNYKEKGYARFDSDDSASEGAGARRRKRASADEAEDFAPDAAAPEGDAQDDDMLPHKKKHKKREAADSGAVHDPELDRVVQPWSGTQAEMLARAWLRYGPDRLDKVAEGGTRDHDEVQQLLRALALLLDELAQLPEAQPARKAAATAGMADGAPAAADAAKEEEAAARARSHGALPPHTVSAIRDALTKAGVTDKLPPACRKALLGNSMMQALARNPAALKQQVEEHRKVHAAVVKAGLAPQAIGSKTAAAGEATPKKQARDGAATPPAAAVKSPGKQPRVVPRVPLRGFKQLPAWWCRDHDERLLLGSYKHGYSSHLKGIMEDILADPELGFNRELALDPVAALVDAHPPPPAPAAPPPAAAGGEAAAAPAPQQQQGSNIPPGELARAKAQREGMQLAARVRDQQLQLYSPNEWKKLFAALMNRLRKVRSAMLDPNFVEAPTTSKPKEQPQLNLSKTPGSAPGTAGGGAPGAQQRLNLTPMGVAMPVMLPSGVQVMAVVGQCATPQQQQQALQQQLQQIQQTQRQQQQLAAAAAAVKAATKAHAAAASAQAAKAAAGRGLKRQADEVVEVLDDDSEDFQPAKQQQRGPGAFGGAAAVAPASKKPKPAAAAGKQQQDGDDVVDLASEDLPSPPPHGNAAAAAGAAGKEQKAAAPAAAAAAPSSGLQVKRVTASQLSDRSVEVDEPSAAAPADSGCTPASGRLHSSGKQQMQQLLGSSERAAGVADSGSAVQQAAAHPVYGGGTPVQGEASAAAAGGSKRKAKALKEDNKQRKLSEFFSAKT